MTIHDDLRAELVQAMKAGDRPRRDVIRQIETEVSLARSAPGFKGDEGDSLYRATIGAYVKRMEKAIEEYRGLGERGAPMVEKLTYEVTYLSRWLPTRLGEAETRALVHRAIAELGVEGDPKAAGRVTGHLMKAHRDELDGTLVNRLVREALEASPG